MADSPKEVLKLSKNIHKRAEKIAKKDLQELVQFSKNNRNIF
jgi:Zn-dependent oligopeptidase